ncbi:helix-turn-helix transcriptional regulator [Novosphingobium sp. ZN18A2]|uniref:helix-turn-helix transcriptional regulator n=1 Tax=Novosphingobium sp. ZN18A2 TaxID=3079861 RepID=UPI0030D1D577
MGEMISIPLEEYRSLQAAAEELADLQAYDRALAQLANGDEELLPAELVKRMLSGESPLRVWREYRGLTQTALAEASSVNRVQIADIESGRKSGSIETVRKLAETLGITLDELI